MAISFSRPDPSSPAAVGSAAFPVARRGFEQGEVRDFLRMVAAELARLQERERFLESELRQMQTRGLSAPGRLDEETVTTLLGEEAARVLSTARDASTQIRDRAEESATRLVKDAAEDAARIRESAQLEAARIHEDALRDAEQEIELAKQQGRDMVNEARAYREKVLSELSRRRDAARSQIEQLLHGRDRLLNAFERARLASEDVINGLTDAHDEPEFIVDLSPTTGPVPVVNPEHPSVKPFDREDEDVVEEKAFEPSAVIDFATTIHADHEEAVVEEIIEDLVHILAPEDNETSSQHVTDFVADQDSSVEVLEIEHQSDDVPTETIVDDVNHNAVITHDDDQSFNVDDDNTQTNVVSLFGRGRRPVEVPEISDSGEQSDVAEEVGPSRSEAASAVDDIFARLRQGAVADVAAQATQADKETDNKTPAPTKTKEQSVHAVKEKKKAVAPMADPAVFAARDEALSSLVVAMSRKLKRVLADEQNEVLQHLKLKKSSLEIDAFLGAVSEHAKRYVSAMTEELMAAAGAGAKSMKPSGGSSRRVTQKALSEYMTTVISESFIAGFREDTRIAIGEAEGDRNILSGLMRDVYRAWKMDHLDQHIDDIVRSAYNKGLYLALEPGATISWVVDPHAPCCSECEDNSLAGALAKGSEFPTGHLFAPAHHGCRCLIQPIQD